MRNVTEKVYFMDKLPEFLKLKQATNKANTAFSRFNSERREDLTGNNFSFSPYKFACFDSFLSFFDDFGIRNRR
jgi:hypothetical protein